MSSVVCMDCLDGLKLLGENSVDAIVTDPPYGLSFMGRRWDYDVPSVETWAECLRVLKPGGYLLAFAGTRTQHRMAVRIEDAGFEIRDLIAWVYGSGFPKSLDVSKAVDRAAGARQNPTRPGVVARDGEVFSNWDTGGSETRPRYDLPATEAGAQWQGWGTALKPALEPITVARKPLDGTVAENVRRWGVGGLNIDGCRVTGSDNAVRWSAPRGGIWATDSQAKGVLEENLAGRWPANLIHDGSDEVLAAFPQAPGQLAKASTSGTLRAGQNTYSAMSRGSTGQEPRGDAGNASRFFYCAKASRQDRDEGLSLFQAQTVGDGPPAVAENPRLRNTIERRNTHPTVKPTALMCHLVRLVTPAGGLVVDPFAGSGSTGKAAALEGFQFLGFEREPDFAEIANARIDAAVTGRVPSTTPDSE